MREKVIETNEKSIEEQGEGIVLYICGMKDEKIGRCLAVCKVKTLEYRIFRKLR